MTTLREAAQPAPSEPTAEMLKAALDAWLNSTGSTATESMRAALVAALATVASDCANSHQPQPLTDAEIDWLIDPWWNSSAIAEVLASSTPPNRRAAKQIMADIVRAAERAHGIGTKP